MPGKVTPRDARTRLSSSYAEPRRPRCHRKRDPHRRCEAVATLRAARCGCAHEHPGTGAGAHRLETVAAHLLRALRAKRKRRAVSRVQFLVLGRMGGVRL